MQPEQTPHHRPQEQQDYDGYAQDLRERLQSGLLSELTPYPQFVVWKYTLENQKLKKRPYQPKTHLPAKKAPPRKKREKTKADYEAFKSAAGSWKDVKTDRP